MEKILLTGAGGFLGQIFFSSLSNRYLINALGRNSKSNIICDLSLQIPNLSKRYNLVVHAAGKAHMIPKIETERLSFFDVNLQGTKNLCAALEALPKLPEAFIFISTVAVYGLDKGEKIHEDYPLNGNTPYAKSKILAEQWLQEWCEKNKIRLGILRLPLIAGLNPPGNLGAMINAIKRGKYLSIGRANARKSMVWAEDIAQIIPQLAEVGGIYNLTDGCHPTFAELESAISLSLRKEFPKSIPLWIAKCLAYLGDIVGDKFPLNSDKLKKITSTLTFDDTKARMELDWNPTAVLDKICEIT